jgi:hypothetical protein
VCFVVECSTQHRTFVEKMTIWYGRLLPMIPWGAVVVVVHRRVHEFLSPGKEPSRTRSIVCAMSRGESPHSPNIRPPSIVDVFIRNYWFGLIGPISSIPFLRVETSTRQWIPTSATMPNPHGIEKPKSCLKSEECSIDFYWRAQYVF